MPATILTRRQLYELVWSAPLLSLSKRYDISDVGLRKMCRRMQVPVPNSGHWARLPMNRMAPLKLLTKYNGQATVELQPRDTKNDAEKIALKDLVQEFRDKRICRIFEKLNNPDKLITESQKVLNEKDGSSYRYTGLLTSERSALDISVLPENIDRALCFMDAVIKGLRARGHDVVLHNGDTYALIFDEKVRMTFRDRLKREVVNRNGFDWTGLVPTGMVSFRVRVGYNDKEFKDGTETIEQQLPVILAKLEMAGQKMAKETMLRKKRWALHEKKEKREKALKVKREKELADFKNLLAESTRWRKAQDLREYIDRREKHARENNLFNDDFVRWLEWAKQKADWYNPFIESKDEMLSNIEKDNPDLAKGEPIVENDSFLPTKNWFQKSFYHKK